MIDTIIKLSVIFTLVVFPDRNQVVQDFGSVQERRGRRQQTITKGTLVFLTIAGARRQAVC